MAETEVVNRGGRPEVRKNIAAIARQHGEKAINTLAALLDDADPRVRKDAATAILDRGYGKPAQPLAGDPDSPILVEQVVRRIVRPDTGNPDR